MVLADLLTQHRLVINDSWNCASSVNCENVYSLYVAAPNSADSLNVSVTSVTGSSVPRLSVFGPGVPLSGINLLNGSTNDHVCPNPPGAGNQNANLSGSTPSLAGTGVYQVVVGRDWGSSGGAAGNYTLTVSQGSNAGFDYNGQTANNVPTQSTGMQCP